MDSDNVLRVNPRDPDSHRRMISTPDLWPLGAILPLSRAGRPKRLGVLIARAGVPRCRVFTTLMYDRRVMDVARGKRAEHESIPHLDYPDIDSILEAGWRVD